MGKQLSEGVTGFIRLVERQMLLHNERRKLTQQRNVGKVTPYYQFITISRDIGALGSTVASEIALHLKWKVYDREIVDYIVKHANIRHDLVAQLDEKAQDLFHDSVARWLSTLQGQNSSSDEYHIALIKALATLAAQGNTILLGHGGAYALQEQPGLHLKITASLPVRIRRLCSQWGTSFEDTRARILRTDSERRAFIQHHFKPDRNDSKYFHLIINTDNLTVDYVVSAIVGIIEKSKQRTNELKPPLLRSHGIENSDRIQA